MIEAVFRNFILAHPAFASVLVYQERIPQSAPAPVAVIRKLGGVGTHDMGYQPAHRETSYRVTCYTKTAAEAIALGEGLRGLDGFNLAEATAAGRDLTWQAAGSELQAAMISFVDELTWEEDAQLHRLVVDFDLIHNETLTPLPIP